MRTSSIRIVTAALWVGTFILAPCTYAAWSIETLDSIGDMGEYNSLAIASNGNPRIAYWDETNGNLRYAVYAGSSWNYEIIDSSADEVGEHCDLAITDTDKGRIAYYDRTNQNLMLAYEDESQWYTYNFATGADVGSHASIDVDSDGDSHVAHHDNDQGDLEYTYVDGGDWYHVTVDSEDWAGLSIAFVYEEETYTPHFL